MPHKAAQAFSIKRKARAVFLLLLLMLGIQAVIFYINKSKASIDFFYYDERLQHKIDSQKLAVSKPTIYPFNPNYISDYRAYFLELSPEEIDRLHHYRTQGKWVNSAAQFQAITKVSNEWMIRFSPYFEFPFSRKQKAKSTNNPVVLQRFDLNTVSAKSLQRIHGIGPVLSERIVKYKNYLKAFSNLDQLREVYGLSPEVLERLDRQVFIDSLPIIQKIDLNQASINQLANLPYLNREEAKQIVLLRTRKGKIDFYSLHSIRGFDSLKIKRLTLYLF